MEKPSTAYGEEVEVAGLVEYQEGSIVSRTLLEKKTGTVTVFAFDKDQALSEHTAPFDAMVHVLEGGVEIRIAGKAHNLSSGQVIIMPANQPHALKATSAFKMILTMIRS